MRQYDNKYWQGLCYIIKSIADCAKIIGLFEGMKKAIGLHTSKCVLLKSKDCSIMSYLGLQMELWVEHYAELEKIENTIFKLLCLASRHFKFSANSTKHPL